MAIIWSKTSKYGKNFAARCARGLIVIAVIVINNNNKKVRRGVNVAHLYRRPRRPWTGPTPFPGVEKGLINTPSGLKTSSLNHWYKLITTTQGDYTVKGTLVDTTCKMHI